MDILSFGAIALLFIGAILATFRNIVNRQQARMTERLQAVTARQLDPEAVLQWRTRTQIRSRLKSYTYHS